MNSIHKTALIALVLALAATVSLGAGEQELRRHVDFLASEELAGRLTGSPGEKQAVDYVGKELTKIGALPLPGRQDLLLPFDFTAGTNDAGSTLRLAPGPEQPLSGTDVVRALSFSDNGSVSGELVFAGYGLTIPEGTEEELSYDSYVGIDVKDKIVLVLRYFPEDVDQDQRSILARYSGLRYKALRARELGAKAIVLITGPRSPNAGETIPMTFDTALSGSGILAASIDGATGEAIFSHVEDKSLEQAQAALDTGNPHVTGFAIPGLTLTLEVKVEREQQVGHSVAGYLPARVTDAQSDGPPPAIVLGAHLDHLGHGKHGNSLAKKGEEGMIHYGADDNASGVAALLAIGAKLAETPGYRPVVLAFWSGEELGLLGATHFIKDEVLAADQIAAYANFDMVGRMKENRLVLQAAGSSSIWPRLIEQTNVVVGFDVNMQEDPYLPTDSTAFYQAKIPTLNFFTGSHEDYHRPTDLPATLNYEDLERVVQFGTIFARKLRDLKEEPDYLKVEPNKGSGGSRDGLRAFTGTIPDYTVEVEGLRLSGVVGGGPADQAGLREGDVIVEFAGQSITNIYDYTYALDAVKIDVPVQVVFMRDGEKMEVTITPGSRD